jgi:hypothetical protein
MKNGVCPKCQGKDVRGPGPSIGHGGFLFISRLIIPKSVGTSPYVCMTCGYVERYVEGDQDLSETFKSWPKGEKENT